MTGHVAYAQRATQKLPYKWITEGGCKGDGNRVRQILAVEKNERENEKSPSKRRKRFSNLPNGNHFLIKVAASLQSIRRSITNNHHNHRHHHHHHRQFCG